MQYPLRGFVQSEPYPLGAIQPDSLRSLLIGLFFVSADADF